MIKKTLANGIRLFIEPTCSQGVTIALFFKGGAAYEQPDEIGIFHMIEHLFFRNLDDLDWKTLFFEVDKIGAVFNAATYRDFIKFEITIKHNKFFEKAWKILFHVLSDFEWTATDLIAEKAVIKNQIRFKGYDFFGAVERLYFDIPAFDQTIMGTQTNIENLSLSQINLYKKAYFNCNNCCVVIAGTVSDQDLNTCIAACAAINNAAPPIKQLKLMPRYAFSRKLQQDALEITTDDICEVCLSFDIDLHTCKNIGEIQMLASIIAGGDGSRLNEKLVYEHCLTDAVTAVFDAYFDIGRLVISYEVEAEHLEKSLDLVFSELHQIKLQLSKKDILSNCVFFTKNLMHLSSKELAMNLGWFNFILHYPYDLHRLINANKTIDEITIQRTAQRILRSDNLFIHLSYNEQYEHKIMRRLGQLRSLLDANCINEC